MVRLDDQSRDSTAYDDDLWSFFQNCWHLKDWIKNDSTLPTTLREQIEQIVAGYPNIIVCADLANRTKHSNLTRVRVDARFTQRNVTVNIGNPTSSTSEHIITLGDGTQLVALAVAKRAIEEWKEIFALHGLLI